MQVKLPDFSVIVGYVKELAMLVVSLALALLLLGATMRATGHPIPYIPVMEPTPLAYLMGCYWLYRH
jgi:hypothetical protein